MLSLTTAAMAVLALSASAKDSADPLPDPDGKPADISKPVKVFLILGQSNAVVGLAMGEAMNGLLKTSN